MRARGGGRRWCWWRETAQPELKWWLASALRELGAWLRPVEACTCGRRGGTAGLAASEGGAPVDGIGGWSQTAAR
jgi:hypothetical protein